MPQYRKKTIVQAEQFFYDRPRMRGVFYPPTLNGSYVGDAFVVTSHGQRVYLQNGDWVIAESDGEHYYPCKDEIFAATYEPADMPDALAAMTQRAEAAEAKLAAALKQVAEYSDLVCQRDAATQRAVAKLAAVPLTSLLYCWYAEDGEREDEAWEDHAGAVGVWLDKFSKEAQP